MFLFLVKNLEQNTNYSLKYTMEANVLWSSSRMC
jgi:hypothetical protein